MDVQNRMDFYSARLLFIIVVDDGRPRRRNHYDESVIVFRARNFDHAFRRALDLGGTREVSYRNHRGETVRWALVRIERLDLVGKKMDGNEVSSRLHYRMSKQAVSSRTRFHPERSKPGSSF